MKERREKKLIGTGGKKVPGDREKAYIEWERKKKLGGWVERILVVKMRKLVMG